MKTFGIMVDFTVVKVFFVEAEDETSAKIKAQEKVSQNKWEMARNPDAVYSEKITDVWEED